VIAGECLWCKGSHLQYPISLRGAEGGLELGDEVGDIINWEEEGEGALPSSCGSSPACPAVS